MESDPSTAYDVTSGPASPPASLPASLPEVHRTVAVPAGAGFWRKLVAFAGPGFLVAVGYMDPGNWATDIAGGARVRLRAALRPAGFEPDGDPAAALASRLGIVTGATSPRPAASSYSPPDEPRLLGLCRNRHRRLRPGRSDRLGHRPEPALPHSAADGRLSDGARRARHPLSCSTAASATLEVLVVTLIGTIGGLLAVRDSAGAAAIVLGVRRGFVPRRRSCATATCSTSPSASSAPR